MVTGVTAPKGRVRNVNQTPFAYGSLRVTVMITSPIRMRTVEVRAVDVTHLLPGGPGSPSMWKTPNWASHPNGILPMLHYPFKRNTGVSEYPESGCLGML